MSDDDFYEFGSHENFNHCDPDGMGEIQIEEWELEKICADVTQMVKLVTYKIRMESEEIMIKRSNSKSGGAQRSSTPARTNGLEFLGIKHLTDEKENESSEFEITWAGTPESAGVNNRFNALVAVKVQRVSSGQRYWWMLSDGNPNLDALCNSMTDDETKWVKRHVKIFLEQEFPSEKFNIRSEIMKKAKEASA